MSATETPSARAASLAGTTIDRYAVEALIGRGGMGEVYRAVDDRLRRKVALKVLRPDRDQPDAVARLFREARAAAALSHPNTVAIHDIGESDGIFYIVMELVNGQPLLAYVGDDRVSLARKVRWLVEIGRALAGAHKAGVIHRDVKPSNVMVSEDDIAKVLDFGLAKPVEPKSFDFRTAVGRVVGTARYMAPETLAGVDADARSDQYSFGVTAYELLSGQYPNGQPLSDATPLDRVASGISADCARVIARAMSLRADSRFRSMNDVVAALEDVAANRPVRGSLPGMTAVVPPTRAPTTPKMAGAPSTAPEGSPESSWGPDTVRDPNAGSSPNTVALPPAAPTPAEVVAATPTVTTTFEDRQEAHLRAHNAARTLLSKEKPSDLKLALAGGAPPKHLEMAATTMPLERPERPKKEPLGPVTLTAGKAPAPVPVPPATASAPPPQFELPTPPPSARPTPRGQSILVGAILVLAVASVVMAVVVVRRSSAQPIPAVAATTSVEPAPSAAPTTTLSTPLTAEPSGFVPAPPLTVPNAASAPRPKPKPKPTPTTAGSYM